MQLKSPSPKQKGARLRKKHKRLDAICENVYNQNRRSNLKEEKVESESPSEIRRSSRVRRAPDVLDASPPPVKKRKKKVVSLSGEKRNSGSGLKSGKSKDEESEKLGFEETPEGCWRSRLRSKGKGRSRSRSRNSVGSGGWRGETSRRRKLFHEEVEMGKSEIEGEELDDDDDDDKLIVLKSKRPGRVKALNGLENQMKKDKEGEGEKDDRIGKDEIAVVGNEVMEDDVQVLSSDSDGENIYEVGLNEVHESVSVLNGENGREDVDVNIKQPEKERLDCLELEKRPEENCNVENGEQINRKLRSATGMEVDNEGDILDETPMNEVEDHNNDGGISKIDETPTEVGDPNKEGEFDKTDDTQMNEVEDLNKEKDAQMNKIAPEIEKNVNVEKLKRNSLTPPRPRVKQGRCCGLCGCADDGKPPKKIQDGGDSENETYSGSSASEEPNYDIWDGFGDEPGWLGRLLGPINDRHGIAGIWVHQHCAVWSPEVYFAGLGCLKNVRAALCRGRALKCTRCGRRGATIGCRVDRCPKTYHLPCARANGCIFDHRRFLIACTDHRHLFQPHGNKYLMRIKKLKARKMKLELRKQSNDAWRRDVEAEEKWLENCGEDEEFLKREGKRLQRDLLRIAPVYIGGSNSESIKLLEGWESVAGLKDVIQCMKEVVILPLLYPEFFNNLGITPPRGVLLHGYPGTGKTLVVRALIGSCARGDKQIAYFARKGADCLGKYVGDAERQLRLLFQVAEKCQPSIIFFDEIDGLAPCRTRQQDQTHSSVVSTLLALMDGLKSRGSVVVIGATNRPESIDPALRRPGRFDREIYFPLPSLEDRAAILSLHTQRWPKPVTGSLLQWVARKTVGFAGADLQALCTQAAIIALKRNFPLHAMLSAAGEKAPGAKPLPLPAFTVEERDWLEALSFAPPPCSRREAGIAAHDLITSPLPAHLIPCLLDPLSKLLVSLYLDERLWLPPHLYKAAKIVESVIVSTLEKQNLPINQWWFHVDSLLKESIVAEEIQRRLSFAGLLIEGNRYARSYAEINDDGIKFEHSVHNWRFSTSLSRGLSLASRKISGYRILVAGVPGSGQRHIASCILHCFIGNVEIQKVDLATISQEGHGDMVQGITELLMKCASLHTSVIFMPRIDLWALELRQQVTKESNSPTYQLSNETEFCRTPNQDDAEEIGCRSTDVQDAEKGNVSDEIESGSPLGQDVEEDNESYEHQCRDSEVQQPQSGDLIASHAWCSFVEQVEFISESTSLIILATSELPDLELPQEIMQFFKSNISSCSELTPLEHTVPRFLVRIAEDFDRDEVACLSAAKMLRDITEVFVSSVHQKAHAHSTTPVEYKFFDSTEACRDTENHINNNGSVVVNCEQFPHDHSKISPPPSNRSLKGKPNLLLAISTFGYQILRYPHFAELCWVTSKLKEGPCADVSGPWKGWPFNSCIIRPGSTDKMPATCSTGNVKSKDRYGLVRGLVAVGLSAYGGVYKSIREVAFEVRKVLELLVDQVNEKIQAGKDRYQYIRLLSQVAYLEDMVNSWAYALQSLELDNHMKAVNASQGTSQFPCDHASMDDSRQNAERKGVTPNENAPESDSLERSLAKNAAENSGAVELNEVENGFGHADSDDKGVVSGDLSPEQIVHCDHTLSDKNLPSSTSDKQLVYKNANEHNGAVIGHHKPDCTDTFTSAPDHGSLKHSNGLTVTEVIHSEDDNCFSSEPCANKFSGTANSRDQIGGIVAMDEGAKCKGDQPSGPEVTRDIHRSSGNGASWSADSEIMCSYTCCSACLNVLHRMIRKIIVNTWELNSCWRADDIHDVVSLLSVDLISAIRKVDMTSNSSPGNSGFGIPELSESSEGQDCHCQGSGTSLAFAKECGCHSADGPVTAMANSDSELGIELEFTYRDGILVHLDSNKVVSSFHCKYEMLCLCSIIKLVAMMKQSYN